MGAVVCWTLRVPEIDHRFMTNGHAKATVAHNGAQQYPDFLDGLGDRAIREITQGEGPC